MREKPSGHAEEKAPLAEGIVALWTSRTNKQQPDIPTVRTIDPSYQPTKAELEEGLRVDATFEEALKAVTRTVKVQYYKPERKRR